MFVNRYKQLKLTLISSAKINTNNNNDRLSSSLVRISYLTLKIVVFKSSKKVLKVSEKQSQG